MCVFCVCSVRPHDVVLLTAVSTFLGPQRCDMLYGGSDWDLVVFIVLECVCIALCARWCGRRAMMQLLFGIADVPVSDDDDNKTHV